MPDILIGSFKRTEANRDTQETLATPHLTWNNVNLSHCLCLGAVYCKLNFTLNIELQEILQSVVILILGRCNIKLIAL